MAVGLSNLEVKIRTLLNDNSRSRIPGDFFTHATSSVYTPMEENVIALSTVFQNTTELGSGQWSYNSNTNKVTISATLVSGDTVELRYTYYANYSSVEIQNYVKAALIHLGSNNYKTFISSGSNIYPEPTIKEQNLIAMVTAILIMPDNKSIRLPDLSISFPRDVSTHEKVKSIIASFKKDSRGIFGSFPTEINGNVISGD